MPKDHQPIQDKYSTLMNAFAKMLDEELNPDSVRLNGFCLLVFPFGQANGEHRCNYVSNAIREDMIATMKEFIARNEGRYVEPKDWVKFPLLGGEDV